MNHSKPFRLFLPGRAKEAFMCFCLALLCLSLPLNAQNRVGGTVLDQNGQPVEGAVVQVKGTNNGTVTDAEGRWSLSDVKQGSALVFSSIGYEVAEMAYTGQSTIDFSVREEMTSLDDVVVIGYGSVKKRDLTGSIASVDAEKVMAKSPANVFEALQGAAAGVQVTTNSGAPGEGATIRIRGTATFGSGVDPLYVVDNVPMSNIDDLNPDDIASLEVLKDAASAAIYGSRSANGVILITTKKGVEGHPKVDVKYKHGFGRVAHLVPQTTPQNYRFYNEERRRHVPSGSNWRYIQDSLRWFINGDGNQYGYLLQTSQKDEVNLSVAAANDKFNYFLSGGYYNEKGVIVDSRYQRLTTRMNASYKATDWLTLGNNFQFSFSRNDGVDMVNILNNVYTWLPFWNVFDENGDAMGMMGGKWSTYAKATMEKIETLVFNGVEQLWLEAAITPHLKLRTNLSGSMRHSQTNQFTPKALVNATGHSSGYYSNTLNYNLLNEDYITYENEFGLHAFSLMGGMSFQTWTRDYGRLYGQDFNNDIIWTLNNATAYPAGDNNRSSREEHAMASFFARATYNYASKYLLAANVRYDGSSRFSQSRRWGFFPSASAGWRFSDEPFFEWAKPALVDGKLRLSYGVTGNEDIANYASWPLYTSTNTYNGVGGLAPNLTYADLGWERTEQYDLGLDLSFFKSRLTLGFDYYIKNTSDLLYDVQVPKETGFNSMTMNVGAIRNKGFEFSLNAKVIQTREWGWEVGFNISRNDAVVVELADHASFYTGSNSIVFVQEEHRLGEFYGIRHDGIFAYDQSNAFDENWKQLTPVFNASGTFDHYELDGAPYTGKVNQKKQGTTVLKAGDVNWLDAPDSQDGVIDWTEDKVLLGCSQADYYGGASTTLYWKGFTLNMAFNFSLGGDIYNQARYRRDGYTVGVGAPSNYFIEHAWTKPGDQAEFPKLDSNRSVNKQACTDFWIEDGSFVRLSSARLAYAIPESLLQRIKMKSASIYLYGSNLLTWTRYQGFDPEFGGEILAPGVDTGRYPRTREFGIGINVGF